MSSSVEDDVRVHRSSYWRDLRIGEKESTSFGGLRRVTCRLDVEHDEFGRLGDIGKGRERCSPVRRGRDVTEGEGGGVDEIELVTDSVTDDELRNVGHRSSDFERETDDVVPADRDDLDGVGELGVGRRVLDVLRDELFGRFGPAIEIL